MLTNMKKFFLFVLTLLFINIVNAESYYIKDVNYKITGITRQYALETKVKIDRKKIFGSEDELRKYLDDIVIQMLNTRTFDNVTYTCVIDDLPSTENSISEKYNTENDDNTEESELPQNTSDNTQTKNVTVTFFTTDTKHLIATPYPKYKSGDSLTAMIKVKDTNFAGSMENFTANVDFAVELNKDDEPESFKTGFSTDFGIPFKMGKLDTVWDNSIDFSYTFGDSSPEWDFETGLKMALPFDKYSLIFNVRQSFIKNFDYEGEWKGTGEYQTYYEYNDSLYFVENVGFSIPIVIQEVNNWGRIYYTPFVNATYNWDFDGIHKDDSYLLGPAMSFGQTISTGRVNWIENFRNGINVSLTQLFGYNFNNYAFNPGITAELKLYKAFKNLGLSADFYAYAYMNGTENFGSRLRGIRKDQYYDSTDPEIAILKSTDAQAAFVFNFDMPIKLFRIYWEKVPVINKIKASSKFNLEAQISPFVDIALFKNEETGTSFNIKDSFISGGIEGIIYPLRWKGIQVRGSLGIDLTRKMPVLKGKVNQDWRESCKSYEISIGIGLHY